MRYKLPIIIFIISIFLTVTPNFVVSSIIKNDISKSLMFQNYFTIVGFLLGLVYIYVLIKYSNNNWIKVIAGLFVISSLINIPYHFMFFRTFSSQYISNNYIQFAFIASSMFFISGLILFISSIMLFVNNIRISIKIIFFITGVFGVYTTPLLYQNLTQITIYRYDIEALKFLYTINYIVAFVLILTRVYIAYTIIKDDEEKNQIIYNPVIKPDYKY